MDPYLFWNMHQQYRIGEAEKDARVAKGKANRAEEEVRELRRTVAHLSLASQALWELLRDRLELTERDVLERMEEIDLRDGKLDQQIGAKPLVCSECGRRTRSAKTKCFYCGAGLTRQHTFE